MPAADLPPAVVRAGNLRATLAGRRITVRRDGRRTLTAVLGQRPRGAPRVERRRVTRRFTTPSGKRRVHRLDARALTVRYRGGDRVELLAARDGVAFRTTGLGDARFRVPGARWLQKWRPDYENPYVRGLRADRYGFPALFRHRGAYTLLTESGAARDAVSRLDGDLRLELPAGERAPRRTPWRIAITGGLDDVVASDLPLTLGPPSRLPDARWVEPGKAVWSWWADRGSGFSFRAQYDAVDRAVANGWRYVTIDAGWDAAWAREVVAYAAQRGVKVILWYDVDDVADPRRTFAELRSWGVAGVKLDFVLSDRAKRVRLMDDLAAAAARNELVVDFHGCTLPRGIQRRWPNVLTLEAVKGAEYWSAEPADPAQNVNYVFTRNVVGGMDYTPVTPSAPGRRTTVAHELALSVVYESGLQHFPDAYGPVAQDVLNRVPVAWDDTRLVAGAPDSHAVVARRSGNTWWVGGIVAGRARTVRVPLSFLGRGRWAAGLVTEGLATSQRAVGRRTTLRIPVRRDGGFVIGLRPVIAAVLAALALAGPAYGPDRVRYEVDVTHTERALRGTERIAFHNPFDAPLTHVWVRRWDGAYRGCNPGCTTQRIALEEPVPPDGEGAVEVPVDLRVPGRFDRFGSHGPIDIFGNGLPVLAVSEDGAKPRLPPYTFRGESFFSLTAAWDVDVTLRPGERVAGTGEQTGRDGDTVTLEAPAERDFTIAAGPMHVAQTTAAGIRVRWFSRRGARPAQRRLGLRMAARSLVAQQRRLGPYGAPEFDALQTPASIGEGAVAMEYPQFILSPPFRFAVNHEVAHQWFYRLVGNDQYTDPWVDETLTSFAAARLGRRVNGSFLAGCARRPVPSRPALPVDSGMAVFDRRGRIGQVLYRAAPCILFDLQRRIGERRMDRFLRALVRTYRGGVLDTAQLTRAIAALPTGRRTLRELRVRRAAGR